MGSVCCGHDLKVHVCITILYSVLIQFVTRHLSSTLSIFLTYILRASLFTTIVELVSCNFGSSVNLAWHYPKLYGNWRTSQTDCCICAQWSQILLSKPTSTWCYLILVHHVRSNSWARGDQWEELGGGVGLFPPILLEFSLLGMAHVHCKQCWVTQLALESTIVYLGTMKFRTSSFQTMILLGFDTPPPTSSPTTGIATHHLQPPPP